MSAPDGLDAAIEAGAQAECSLGRVGRQISRAVLQAALDAGTIRLADDTVVCPNVVTSEKGTSYCSLAESSVRVAEARCAQVLAVLDSTIREYAWAFDEPHLDALYDAKHALEGQ